MNPAQTRMLETWQHRVFIAVTYFDNKLIGKYFGNMRIFFFLLLLLCQTRKQN